MKIINRISKKIDEIFLLQIGKKSYISFTYKTKEDEN